VLAVLAVLVALVALVALVVEVVEVVLVGPILCACGHRSDSAPASALDGCGG
jgi:hypothetical protein